MSFHEMTGYYQHNEYLPEREIEEPEMTPSQLTALECERVQARNELIRDPDFCAEKLSLFPDYKYFELFHHYITSGDYAAAGELVKSFLHEQAEEEVNN